MWALVIVEGHPFPDACLCLRAGFPSIQVDAFVLRRPPQPLDEYVVRCPAVVLRSNAMRGEEPAFPIHRDAHAGPAQAVRLGKGRELRSFVGIHDLGQAELVDGLVQRLDAEVGRPLTGRCLHANTERGRVRDAPCEDLPGMPVHDGNEIQEPPSHRQVGDVLPLTGREGVVCPFDPCRAGP